MTRNNYAKLLRLSEYMNNRVVIYLDGYETRMFDSLQHLINRILNNDIEIQIPEWDTYNINFIGIQQSLLDEDDQIVCIYMV